MNNRKLNTVALLIFLLSMSLSAQTVYLKPLATWYFPRLSEVNNNIENDIRNFRNITGADLPAAATFGDKVVFGGQIEYHLGEDFFANIHLTYYKDNADTQFEQELPTRMRLDYLRELTMVDFKIHFHQYFSYSSWRRFNKYFGLGVGIVQVNATSKTAYETENNLQVDTDGDFSGSALSASGFLGATIRLTQALKLWAEAGYLVASFGQLDGKVRSLDTEGSVSTLTESSFDLSGFFLRGGIGFAVPFLK